jgi:hypothetical protein
MLKKCYTKNAIKTHIYFCDTLLEEPASRIMRIQMKEFDYPLLVSILKKIKKKFKPESLEAKAIDQIIDDYSARIRELEEIMKFHENYKYDREGDSN